MDSSLRNASAAAEAESFPVNSEKESQLSLCLALTIPNENTPIQHEKRLSNSQGPNMNSSLSNTFVVAEATSFPVKSQVEGSTNSVAIFNSEKEKQLLESMKLTLCLAPIISREHTPSQHENTAFYKKEPNMDSPQAKKLSRKSQLGCDYSDDLDNNDTQNFIRTLQERESNKNDSCNRLVSMELTLSPTVCQELHMDFPWSSGFSPTSEADSDDLGDLKNFTNILNRCTHCQNWVTESSKEDSSNQQASTELTSSNGQKPNMDSPQSSASSHALIEAPAHCFPGKSHVHGDDFEDTHHIQNSRTLQRCTNSGNSYTGSNEEDSCSQLVSTELTLASPLFNKNTPIEYIETSSNSQVKLESPIKPSVNPNLKRSERNDVGLLRNALIGSVKRTVKRAKAFPDKIYYPRSRFGNVDLEKKGKDIAD